MGIDEFDKLCSPMPPLDDDPFASLSATNIAAMEATPNDDAEGSGSKYEEEEEGEDEDDDE
jgi:hypothetical protein